MLDLKPIDADGSGFGLELHASLWKVVAEEGETIYNRFFKLFSTNIFGEMQKKVQVQVVDIRKFRSRVGNEEAEGDMVRVES